MLNKLNFFIFGAAIRENDVTGLISSIFASVGNVLKAVGAGISGLGTVASGIILTILIFKTMSEAKGGNPEAWKDSTGKIVVVAVLMVVLAVVTSVLL